MRRLLGLSLLLTLLACSTNTSAASPEFNEDVEYKVVNNPETRPNPQKIEVREFFWYGCPHCYQFESEINPWLLRKSEDISFKRVPHSMGRNTGDMHSLAFHMAEHLGILKLIHPQMFKAIQDRKQNMDTLADICGLFQQFGNIKEDRCRAAAENDEVLHARDHDEFLIRRYGIALVPTLVVDGRYVTNASMAGGTKKLIDVLNFLIAKQIKARNLHANLPYEPPLDDGPRDRVGAPSPF
jgi:thiol:disulfide interchange protein DsbA